MRLLIAGARADQSCIVETIDCAMGSDQAASGVVHVAPAQIPSAASSLPEFATGCGRLASDRLLASMNAMVNHKNGV